MSSSEGLPKGVKKTLVAIITILVFASLYQVQDYQKESKGFSSEPKNTIGYYYDVTKVTDGDTIQVDMDGTLEKVRLIGINTPETVDPRTPVQCFGKEASNRMKDLVEGKIVRLEFDESQDMRDAYGRLLAYVYLEGGEMVNRKMIAEGYAYEYTYLKPYKYHTEFRQLQNIARLSSRGLWSSDTCNGEKSFSQ